MNGMMAPTLPKITAYCQQQPIRRLSLFGSVLRADFTSESDVDMLVEFEPGSGITYLDMVDIHDALTELIGRPVDLLTPAALSPYFRQQVLDAAVVIYERA